MIHFDKFTLENGLKVIVHKDTSTPIVAINLLYNVGARDESPERTGFAHLFEHLMFGGSENIPSYDTPLQQVGGENNAFTNNDITNYYITLPKDNIETGFWLESDRMLKLDFSERSLDVQRNVVIEEFNQRYLNQPYGDIWLLTRPLAYKKHPYQWSTIGKDISHIRNATLTDVEDFFYKYYAPNNAVLVVAGDVKTDDIKKLSQKWFGPIEKRNVPIRNLPIEPAQKEERKLRVKRNVPFDAIFKVYHMCSRLDKDYQATDLISDVLSNGKSARLYQSLVKEKKLFGEINAYITGSTDNGLFVISGKPMKNVSIEKAETEIENEITKLNSSLIDQHELEKIKNKIEFNLQYANMNLLKKATNLAQYENLIDAKEINNEINKYEAVTAKNIQRISNQILQPTNCSTLYYLSDNN